MQRRSLRACLLLQFTIFEVCRCTSQQRESGQRSLLRHEALNKDVIRAGYGRRRSAKQLLYSNTSESEHALQSSKSESEQVLRKAPPGYRPVRIDATSSAWLHPADIVPQGQPCPVPKGAEFTGQSREDVALFSHFFCNVRNGTFVEMGALDGATFSNTRFFQNFMSWGGVLIEGNPASAKKIQEKRQSTNISILQGAACPEGQNEILFNVGGDDPAVTGVASTMGKRYENVHHILPEHNKEIAVPCRPLGKMLRSSAFGHNHIDLFILDVEGAELEVLQTMDWSLPVSVWVVELDHTNEAKDEAVRQLLAQNGYVKSKWNIRSLCKDYHCTDNEVFERGYEMQAPPHSDGATPIQHADGLY